MVGEGVDSGGRRGFVHGRPGTGCRSLPTGTGINVMFPSILIDSIEGHAHCQAREAQGADNTPAPRIPIVTLNVESLDDSTTWLMEYAIIGYVSGPRLPVKVLLNWIDQCWLTRGWEVNNVRNLGNGFYYFVFDDVVAVHEVLYKGSWQVKSSSIAVFPWSPDFCLSNPKPTRFSIWVEFPNLPLAYCPQIQLIASPLGKFAFHEKEEFFNPRLNPQVCMYIDLTKDLPDIICIKVGNVSFKQRVRYHNLSNLCFCKWFTKPLG